MNFKVQDEAQQLLDGLTIKHVHLQTGTPAFLIQHCYGLRGPKRRMNALEAIIRSRQWKRFIEKLSMKYSKKKSCQKRRPGMQTPGLRLAREIE